MALDRAQTGDTLQPLPARFRALDGWRGILALCVAIYHTYWLSNLNSSAFFEQGVVLIDLFFVFSGFLMWTLYGGIRTGTEAMEFFKRRFARLYPVHLVMTLVVLAYAGVRVAAHALGFGTVEPGEVLPFQPGASEGWGSLLSNLLLLQSLGLHEQLTYNVPSWTISTEAAAYLVFAAVCVWAPLRRNWQFWMLGAGVAGLYATLAAVRPDMNITYDLGLLRCLAGFGTGVIAARLYPLVKLGMARLAYSTRTVVEVAVALAFGLFVIYLPGKGQFLVGAFALVFMAVFAQDSGALSRLLSHRAFAYLARISYSVYMVHFIIAVGFGIVANTIFPRVLGDWNPAGWGGDLLLLPYLAVVIIAADRLYRWVEAPAAAWLRRTRPARLAETATAP